MRLRRTGSLETQKRKRDSVVRTYTLEDRLRERTTVEDRGYETPCWVYNGARGRIRKDGTYYVSLRWQGRMVPAHIAAFREWVREPEPGEHVHHKCRTKPCWRPEHLEALMPLEHRHEHHGKFSDDGLCTVAGCERPVRGRGLCSKHYLRAWRAGAFTA